MRQQQTDDLKRQFAELTEASNKLKEELEVKIEEEKEARIKAKAEKASIRAAKKEKKAARRETKAKATVAATSMSDEPLDVVAQAPAAQAQATV